MKFNQHATSFINQRVYQEDFCTSIENEKETEIYGAIFDGHGGGFVSNYINNNLTDYIFKQPKLTKKYIIKIFNKLNNELKSKYNDEATYTGSTAIFVLLKNIKNKIYCTIGNLGDCKCIIINSKMKKTFSTVEHKPNNIKEKKRIEKLGGKIYFDGFSWRIGNLNLTRAFGDFDSTPYISNVPDVYMFKLKKDDKFVITASDGFWDTVSIKECISLLDKYIKSLNKKYISIEDLVQFNNVLQNEAVKNKSHDNITIISTVIQ